MPGRHTVRILVVEDDTLILDMLQDLLNVDRYETVGVSHPDVVLSAAHHNEPDLFIIDIMLPSKSGIEVAQELRQNGFANTPMIGLSASPIMLSVAKESGAFQLTMSKPFDVITLSHEIGRLVDNGDGLIHVKGLM